MRRLTEREGPETQFWTCEDATLPHHSDLVLNFTGHFLKPVIIYLHCCWDIIAVQFQIFGDLGKVFPAIEESLEQAGGRRRNRGEEGPEMPYKKRKGHSADYIQGISASWESVGADERRRPWSQLMHE